MAMRRASSKRSRSSASWAWARRSVSTAARRLSRASAPMRRRLRRRRHARARGACGAGGDAARLAALRRLGPDRALVDPLLERSRPSIFSRSASGSRGSRIGRRGVDLGGLAARRRSARVVGGPSLAPAAGTAATGRDRSAAAAGRGRPPAARPAPDGRPMRCSPPRRCRLGATADAGLPPVRRAVRRPIGAAPSSAGGPTPPPPSRRGGREGSTRGHVRRCYGPATGRKTTKSASRRRRSSLEKSGGVLLSQGVYPQVPSALTGLTSVFGMGTGVTLSLWPPKSVVNRCATHTEDSRASTSCSIQALGRLVPVG